MGNSHLTLTTSTNASKRGAPFNTSLYRTHRLKEQLPDCWDASGAVRDACTDSTMAEIHAAMLSAGSDRTCRRWHSMREALRSSLS
jgi:hypothetical protein